MLRGCLPEGEQRDLEALKGPGGQEQDHQSGEGRHMGWDQGRREQAQACPCSEAEEEQGGRECQLQSCSEIYPS